MAGPRGTDATLGGAPEVSSSGQRQACPGASVGSAVECRIIPQGQLQASQREISPPPPGLWLLALSAPRPPRKGLGVEGLWPNPLCRSLRRGNSPRYWWGKGAGEGAWPFPSHKTRPPKSGVRLGAHSTPQGIKEDWAGERATRTTRAPGAFKETLPFLRRALGRHREAPYPIPGAARIRPHAIWASRQFLLVVLEMGVEVGVGGTNGETIPNPCGRVWSIPSKGLNLLLRSPTAQGPEPTRRSPRRQC